MSLASDMEIERCRALLRDPNAIHANMLRGTIAKPTREQILHLYPEIRDEISRLRKGIQDYLDGDYEPKVKKIDKCPHGQYGYEACEECISEHFQRLLTPPPGG